jgi:di/tricarboxylate transporter
VLVCALAVSLSFITPIGTPPFTLIFSTGYVSRREIARSGLRITLPAMLVVVVLVYIFVELGIV